MSQSPNAGGAGEGARSARLLHPVDTVVALILLAVIGWLYYETTQFAKVSALFAQNIPPTMFPRILLVMLAIFALLMPFEHLLLRAKGKNIDSGRSSPVKGIAWITMGALIAIMAASPIFGTLLTMMLVCLILPILWGERRLIRVAIFAIIFPVIVALLFNLVLGVYFEPGMLNIRLV